MGFPEKAQVEVGGGGGGTFESDNTNNRKWAIAGIALCTPLRPIYTTPPVDKKEQIEDVESETECCSITPTSEESKIPTMFTCPPAPRKRKPSSSKCNYRAVREFFIPPDLETVFIRHVESTN